MSNPNDPNPQEPNPYGQQPAQGQPNPYGQQPAGAPQPYGEMGAYGSGQVGAGGRSANWMGIVSLIAGIVAVVTCCAWFLSAPVAIAAIVFGVLGLIKVKAGEATNKGLSITGIILSGVALVATLAFALVVGSIFDAFEECDPNTMSQTELEECLTEQWG